MIWKKVVKLFLILIASFLVLALGYFLAREVPSYNGQCIYGFPSSYTVPCSLPKYLHNQLGWYVVLFYVIGIFWLIVSIVITIIYGLGLRHYYDLKSSKSARFSIYTMLGTISGLVFAGVAASMKTINGRSTVLYYLSLVVIWAIPIVIGALIDRALKPKNA